MGTAVTGQLFSYLQLTNLFFYPSDAQHESTPKLGLFGAGSPPSPPHAMGTALQ